MNKMKEELQRMQNLGVISKVDEPMEGCSDKVAVPPANSDKVRICVDIEKKKRDFWLQLLPIAEDFVSKVYPWEF